MKTLLLALSLAATGVSTATAQIYAPSVVNGSLLGGIAGAIIGGHNHNNWGEGAIIGAVAGGLLGAAVEPPRAVVYGQPPVTVVQSVPTAPVVPQAPVIGAPQVVYVQQAPQVVYAAAPACYYAPAPVAYYGYPAVNIGLGYAYGPRRVLVRPGFRRW